MTDSTLEKVIKGLECCDPETPNCDECPYLARIDGECVKPLHADALALLKAQEPRVMTLEEVQSAEVVWIEQVGVIVSAIKIYTYLDGTGTMVFLYPYHDYANIVNIRPCDYGKISRCWTSRPTDEQREAEQWE